MPQGEISEGETSQSHAWQEGTREEGYAPNPLSRHQLFPPGGRADHVYHTTAKPSSYALDNAQKPQTSRPAKAWALLPSVTCSCLCNRRSGDRLVSTRLAPAFQYTLPCCCQGKTQAHVHTATHWDHLPETEKDSRPHPKELAPSLPLPFFTHRTHPLSETWFSPLENENSALSTSKLIGRVQERISGLDFGILVKLYLNILLILPEIHSFIQLPIHSFNKHFLST